MISPDKVDRILRLLQSWSRKSTCTRRELESLIGSLHHACRVVVPGRTFLRRMIDLLCSFRNRNHPIRLNLEIRRDLQWWLSFFQDWNGMSFFLSPSVSPLPDLVVSSDASGTWGFGALWHCEWFFSSWFFLPSGTSITFMELVPIVVAAHLWGSAWSRLRVQFLCDNRAVVDILNAGTSKSSDVMHLLRLLTLAACRHNFVFSASHTPGRVNVAADAVSFTFTGFPPSGSGGRPSPSTNSPRVAGSTGPPPRLDCPMLWSVGHRVYAAGQRFYFQFAAAFDFPRFPASEWHLMLFATWLFTPTVWLRLLLRHISPLFVLCTLISVP